MTDSSTDSSTDTSTDTSTDAFLQDALAGLTAEPKTLPGKYLWDETGSDLFDRICHSADYYPTAQEMTVLPQAAADVARQLAKLAQASGIAVPAEWQSL